MILAIDPSLANTAAVAGGADGVYTMATFSSKPRGDFVSQRISRYDDLVHRVINWVESAAVNGPFEAIFIEGYSFGSQGRNEFIAEYGGLLRWHLLDHVKEGRVIEVSPSSLKKFCAGTGNAKKNIVCAAITHRYKVMFPTDDEFDAFGLYRLGLAALGLVDCDNASQREAAAAVLGKKAKPRKKRKKDQPLLTDQ